MSVLVESGHQTTYPLNHARIMWNNVITGATATGEKSNFPASAALTKTTYERWSPAATGDSITLTFPQQYINCITLAAHSNLSPTVEVRVAGQWQTVTAYPPGDGETLNLGFAEDDYQVLEYSPDNEAIMFLIEKRLADAVRITATYTGTAPTLGVVMAGTVLEMHRPLYAGHSPAMLTSDSKVQPNVSESGEWLGASLLRQGRSVSINWNNLPASWVRKHWQPFAQGLKTNPFVVAWNPLKASPDAIYCTSSDQPSPSNSGTRDLQSVSLTARGYSDGTDPVVEALADKEFSDLITFTRASAATYYDAQGVLRTAAVDEPRLTHDPATGEALGLLIEEQRTNLLLWSEAFDNAAWTKVRTTITQNDTTAPDGTQSAGKVVSNTESAPHGLFQTVTTVASTRYTVSFYAKKAEYDYVTLGTAQGTQVEGDSSKVTFNLSDGTFQILDDTPEVLAAISYVGNGWYFCSGSVVTTGTSYGPFIAISPTPSLSHAGDDSSGLYLWGVNVQQGSFPTSYIKTEASQVTRSADNASVDTLEPWFNGSEGTVYCEFLKSPSNATSFALVLGASDSQRVAFAQVGNTIFCQMNGSSGLTALSKEVSVDKVVIKCAMSFKSDGTVVAAINGESLLLNNTLSQSPSRLIIGNQFSGSNGLDSTISLLPFIPRALSATELEALTS